MQAPMKIAVAGATGRVGRHVVDVLVERGHAVVSMSRATDVNVITGDGLLAALTGVECVIDTAGGPEAEEAAATSFFTTSAANLHRYGEQAGVQRIVAVSIIGTDRFSAGYCAAKAAHERALVAGPLPVRIVRAAQFHEFVPQLVDWGTQGEVGYVGEVRTQLVAARSVAEVLANLITAPAWAAQNGPALEVAGPRVEPALRRRRIG